VTCEIGDWFTYADWATISAIYDTPVTLKTVLQDLVDDALGAYGIILHPSQVDGPILAPFLWRNQRVSDALRELSERTKYVAAIAPAKVLHMFLPGTEAAPFEITEAAPHIQELVWADSDRAGGAPVNKVTIICGPTGQREVHDERHYGDGVTRIWPLYAPFVAMIGALHIFSEHAGGYPVGIFGVDDMPYTISLADNTVHQRADQPVIVAGDYFWLWYFAEPSCHRLTGETPVIEARSRGRMSHDSRGPRNREPDPRTGGAAGSQDMELRSRPTKTASRWPGVTVTPRRRDRRGRLRDYGAGATIVLDTIRRCLLTYQIKAARRRPSIRDRTWKTGGELSPRPRSSRKSRRPRGRRISTEAEADRADLPLALS
jgi:hypothetical protein